MWLYLCDLKINLVNKKKFKYSIITLKAYYKYTKYKIKVVSFDYTESFETKLIMVLLTTQSQMGIKL